MINPFSTTGIGSLPHGNAEEACRLILDVFDIPFWPQLPALSFKEFMIPQYSEGMPFVKINPAKQAIWVERDGSDELERFYESYTGENRIAISEDYSRGFHSFLERIKDRRFVCLKGHITGPLTFTLGLKDHKGVPVYFDEELREISLMLLSAKARWQIDMLKQFADNVIIFIDEPILSALGSSSYLGVSSHDSLRLLKEVSDVIKKSSGVSGIHCCGNADWGMVIKSGVDIINFDAYGFSDTLVIYHDEFRGFLENKGYLAWGIIPTTDAIRAETPETIKKKFNETVDRLSGFIPENLLLSSILLTPSCGTGSRDVNETLKVFQLLMRLREAVS